MFFNLSSYPTVTTLRMARIQARLMDAQILNVGQDFVVRTQNMIFEKILGRKEYFLIRWILFMIILMMLKRLIYLFYKLWVVSVKLYLIFEEWALKTSVLLCDFTYIIRIITQDMCVYMGGIYSFYLNILLLFLAP